METPLVRLKQLWLELFEEPQQNDLEVFIAELEAFKATHALTPLPDGWYKDMVVYSLYVDLFNHSFEGLTDKLDYLQDLGVSCLWLLPILNSPMKDAGFDISDYDKVRPELVATSDTAAEVIFEDFVKEAHTRGISVIFDVALNHCSVEHPWFQAAKDDPASAFRDYFIWSDSPEKYKEARIIFKGMMDSNWTRYGDQYYFHRFFDIQPDLNYRNPTVLREMTLMLMRWLARGVDGFRADAIPYLWKEEGTNCENLPKTHTIIKIFRAAMDYVRPGSILLAEANQPPVEVARYFGEGDECLAAYHFPLMPRMYKALLLADKAAIQEPLQPSFTPEIPEICQWFTFLRCHDELTLEMVTPEERALLHAHYCRDPLWDFRQGEGVSGRLIDQLGGDPRKVNVLNAILVTLIGTPVIYYGDEVAKRNDYSYYHELVSKTGYQDSRYLNRGLMDWQQVEAELAQADSPASQVFQALRQLLLKRRNYLALTRGTLEFVDAGHQAILAYKRSFETQSLLIVVNLSEVALELPTTLLETLPERDLLGQAVKTQSGHLQLAPYSYHWFTAYTEPDN